MTNQATPNEVKLLKAIKTPNVLLWALKPWGSQTDLLMMTYANSATDKGFVVVTGKGATATIQITALGTAALQTA